LFAFISLDFTTSVEYL